MRPLHQAQQPNPSTPITTRRLAALLLLLAAFLSTRTAFAQRVLGPATDATVLPRGMVRVSLSPTWERGHERYADGYGRTKKGSVESLAADFNLDTLGLAQLPALGAVNLGVRSILGGTGALPLTLGTLSTRFDRSIATTPFAIDVGVTRRLMVGVVIPFVSTRTEVSLDPNPGGTNATVGLNSAYLSGTAGSNARARNQGVVTQLTSAAQQLQALLQQCMGNTAPACSAVNADRAGAQALVAAATSAATGIEGVYGVSATKPGSRYAPWQNGSVHKLVEARLGNLSTSFAGFLGAPTGASWIDARGLTGAAPMGYADFQRIVTDPAYGVAADSLISVELSRPGDIEFGAKFVVFDAFGLQPPQRGAPGGVRVRFALGGAYRLGTALQDSVDLFADVGTGDGQTDLEGRAFLDLLVGTRFWASAVARYTVQQADEIVRRVPRVAHEPFPPASNRIAVQRDLGDMLAIEVSPRWVVTDHFALTGSWHFVRKGEDTYASVGTPAGGSTLDLSLLAQGTAQSSQRALLSFTYSNLAHYFRRRARAPMEVSFTIGRTLSGWGNAPKQTVSGLSMRVYNQLF
ncbi:MAG: hypothetical protein IT361_16935 [Gemmatimonadaceae bacterium]|nr:hypothetical protein [Gemmatimonadaceae bacterium]